MTTRRLALSLAQAAALAAASAGAEPARYDSPEAAVAALRAALEAEGIDPLLTIFGAESEDLISTGDAAEDADIRARLLEGWDELHRIGRETGGDKAVLYLGRDLWSFPLPLLKADDGTWAFDPVEGRETVIDRRIGRNELDVIELMLAYVRVQRDYRAVDWDGDGVMEFAAHVISTEGTRDGLYWPPEEGAPDSPVGDFVARAAAEGFTVDEEEVGPEPCLGYVYHILSGQTEAAPGGAMEYLVNGNMVAGHALIAYPAAYGKPAS